MSDAATRSYPETAELARKAALFREGTKRIYEGQGAEADMWFFELFHFLDDVEKALSVAQGSWMPIETAPKSGHEVLVVTQGLVRVGFWDDARGGRWSKWPGREAISPTHWMPLPKGPEVSSTEQK